MLAISTVLLVLIVGSVSSFHCLPDEEPISCLKRSFKEEPMKINSLDLGGRNLKKLEKNFFDFLPYPEAVEYLNMSHNGLQQIEPSAFSSLSGLIGLDLRMNDLRSLPPGLLASRSIKYVLLDGNFLSTISPSVYSRTKDFPYMTISDNPAFTCDCNLQIFLGLNKSTFNREAACVLPIRLRGMAVREMNTTLLNWTCAGDFKPNTFQLVLGGQKGKEELSFGCIIQEDPAVAIEWHYKGAPINNESLFFERTRHEEGGMRRIDIHVTQRGIQENVLDDLSCYAESVGGHRTLRLPEFMAAEGILPPITSMAISQPSTLARRPSDTHSRNTPDLPSYVHFSCVVAAFFSWVAVIYMFFWPEHVPSDILHVSDTVSFMLCAYCTFFEATRFQYPAQAAAIMSMLAHYFYLATICSAFLLILESIDSKVLKITLLIPLNFPTRNPPSSVMYRMYYQNTRSYPYFEPTKRLPIGTIFIVTMCLPLGILFVVYGFVLQQHQIEGYNPLANVGNETAFHVSVTLPTMGGLLLIVWSIIGFADRYNSPRNNKEEVTIQRIHSGEYVLLHIFLVLFLLHGGIGIELFRRSEKENGEISLMAIFGVATAATWLYQRSIAMVNYFPSRTHSRASGQESKPERSLASAQLLHNTYSNVAHI